MKYMHLSERTHVTNLYKLLAFIFLVVSFMASHAEAAGKVKKKAVGVKTIAKIKDSKVKAARVPATKSQLKVPPGVPTKLPQKAVQANPPHVGSLRAPASVDSDKSLEIRGQARNLSMLLVLKNRHENIDFVKPRETYRDEIQKTDF